MGLFELHCHLLPGIDDGKVPENRITEVLEVYRDCGFSGLAFTPHLFNPYVTTKVAAIRPAWEKAQEEARRLHLTVYLGSELFVGEQAELVGIPIAGKYQLMEFNTTLPPSAWLERIAALAAKGIVPLIAHVERYTWMTPDGADFAALKRLGALIQVNVDGIQKGSALPYLERGVVDVIASDNHGLDDTLPATLMSIVQKWPDVFAKMQTLGL